MAEPPKVLTIPELENLVSAAEKAGLVELKLDVQRKKPPGARRHGKPIRGASICLPICGAGGARRRGPKSLEEREVRRVGPLHVVATWRTACLRLWLETKARR